MLCRTVAGKSASPGIGTLNIIKLSSFGRRAGGPEVKPPKEKGFGSHLIECAFGGQLGCAQLVFGLILVPSENLIRWIRSRKENRIMIETDGDLLQTSARIYVGLLSFT